jgi:hypothetical protein
LWLEMILGSFTRPINEISVFGGKFNYKNQMKHEF